MNLLIRRIHLTHSSGKEFYQMNLPNRVGSDVNFTLYVFLPFTTHGFVNGSSVDIF